MKFDLKNRMKPPFKWVGGKSRLLDQLVPHFPMEFDRLVEPFCGTASLSLALEPNASFWINDLNTEVFAVWVDIRNDWKKFRIKLICLQAEYNKCFDKEAFYKSIREYTIQTNVSGRFILLNKAGFNGLYRVNQKGGFNVPWGKREKVALVPDNLEQLSEHFQRAKITTLPAFEVVEEAKAGDFLYVDPPYHDTFSSYTKEGFSTDDHTKLALLCEEAVERGAKVAISNSNTEFIQNLYSTWTCHEVLRSGTISSKSEGRQPVRELLFTKGY